MADPRDSREEEDRTYVKVVLVGDGGVGKTNLISRYVENKFNVGTNPTIGLEFSEKTVEYGGKAMVLQIWDTAGQERFRSLNKTFYRNSMGALIIFDLGSRGSFEQVPRWISELRENLHEQAVLLLVGNKCDMPEQKVAVGEALDFAKQEGLGYIQTSAALGTNVAEAFDLLTKKIVERVEVVEQALRAEREAKESKLRRREGEKRAGRYSEKQSMMIDAKRVRASQTQARKKSCCS